MKKVLVLVLCVSFIGCKYGLQTEKQYHRGLFRQYCDSVDKYNRIKSECGNILFKYYYDLCQKEYALTYPNGNDCCPEKKFDTVCYPIKKQPPPMSTKTLSKEDAVWLVKNIFGEDASKDDDIVDFYQRVNEVAMDEYAKQEAIAFAEWMADNEWEMLYAAKVWENPRTSGQFTTEQLYQLYLNQL